MWNTPKIVGIFAILIIGLSLLASTQLYTEDRALKRAQELANESSLSITPNQDFLLANAPTIDYIVITNTPTPSPTPRPPTPTSRPTPTPSLTPYPATGIDIDRWFDQYSKQQSVNQELLKRIARCESGFNAQSRNGIYGGLFQFSESSWQGMRQTMNLSTDTSLRFQPEEAIKTAAFALATHGPSLWANCAK